MLVRNINFRLKFAFLDHWKIKHHFHLSLEGFQIFFFLLYKPVPFTFRFKRNQMLFKHLSLAILATAKRWISLNAHWCSSYHSEQLNFSACPLRCSQYSEQENLSECSLNIVNILNKWTSANVHWDVHNILNIVSSQCSLWGDHHISLNNWTSLNVHWGVDHITLNNCVIFFLFLYL